MLAMTATRAGFAAALPDGRKKAQAIAAATKKANKAVAAIILVSQLKNGSTSNPITC